MFGVRFTAALGCGAAPPPCLCTSGLSVLSLWYLSLGKQKVQRGQAEGGTAERSHYLGPAQPR